MPYSMPLRIILVKWPEPTGPTRPGQGIEAFVGDVTRRHHHPDHARRGQLAHKLLQRSRRSGTLAFDSRPGLLLWIEADHAVAAPHQPFRHFGAHPTQADHSEFHGVPLL